MGTGRVVIKHEVILRLLHSVQPGDVTFRADNGTLKENWVISRLHVPTASEDLREPTYRAESFDGLLPEADQRALREAAGHLRKGQEGYVEG